MSENTKDFERIHSLSVSKIVPNPSQPRKDFSEDSIIKLADSIKQFGIMQPLTVREIQDGYELICGERRLRAAKELGMEFVPCIISNASDLASAEMAIIENLLRQDLNVFEEAEAIETLIDTYKLTQDQVAKKLSVSQSYVANKLRLLRLSKSEREKILDSRLTERHARALLRIYDDKTREKVLNYIIDNELNVTKAEEFVSKIISGGEQESSKRKVYKSISSFYESITRAISAVEESGFKIKSRKIENDSYTELTIIIPKASGTPVENS